MREMKDSGVEWIGYIPASWQTLTVGSLFKVRIEKVNDTDYPPLSVTKSGVVPQMENVAKSDANDNRKMVLANDFVINSRSDRKQSCGVSPLDGSVSLINTVLYPAKGVPIVPEYLNYLLKNYGFAEEFYRWGHGIVADLWTTRWQEMKSILLPIPSMEEQQQILNAISTQIKKVDSLIANVQTLIEKLKAYKQSVITENIAPQDDWRKCRLGQIANFKNGLNYNGLSTAVEIKFLGVGDFHQYFRMDKPEMFSNLRFNGDLPKDLFLQNGDIVFVRSNGSKGLVGRSILIDNVDYPLTYSGFCIRMRNLRKDIIRSEFLMFYFWSHTFRQTLNQNSRGTNISNLNQEMLSALEINFPNIELQDEIVDSLSNQMESIDRLIAIKQEKNEKLEQYKRSLIYEYVTGKKEVC